MKSIGVIRKIDELGRIVIPMETRKHLGFLEKEAVEFFIDGENIILKKYRPGCSCCNEVVQVREFNGIRLCKKCLLNFN